MADSDAKFAPSDARRKEKSKPKKKLDDDDQKHSNPGAPRIPPHPWRGVIAGASGSGKTYACLEHFILDPDSPFDFVVWCAPTASLEQPKLKIAAEQAKMPIIFVDGLDEEKIAAAMDQGKKTGMQGLIVIDDLMDKSSKSPFVEKLFTAGRHSNVSTLELVQRIFTDGSRSHRLNTDLFLVFDFGARSELAKLAQQMSPMRWRDIVKAYEDASRSPARFLMIDGCARRSLNPEHRKLAFRKGFDEAYPELHDA